jgi:hypothetical protein
VGGSVVDDIALSRLATSESESRAMFKARRRRVALLRTRTLAIAVTALIVPVTALASASPAMAEPKGIFKIFNQCPTEVPVVTTCNYNVTSSGEFKLGSTEVPINKNIIQQGGLIPTGNPENEREFFGFPAKNGESLSKTELNVPGGLLDFVNCEKIPVLFQPACKAFFESGSMQVTATTELVATEKNPVILNEFNLGAESGTAVTLPVRVHLKNTFLGKACYIGSESKPLQLHLTTGATSPPKGFPSIHGTLGELETRKENGLRTLHISGNSLVDNTFSAPGSEGCGEAEILFIKFKGFLDEIVNEKSKIPNTAGNNVAKLNGELNVAPASSVIASEGF